MKKVCAFCGNQFEGPAHKRFCDDDHFTACPICGKIRIAKREQLTAILKNGHTACSYECRVKKTQATSLSKYGCKAPGNNPKARKKAAQTMIDKFGVPHAQMSQVVRDKSKQTLMERYGVDNVGKSPEVIQRRLETNKERYGEVLPFNRPESYKKQHETIMQRYGVKYATELPWVTNWSGHISKINQSFADQLSRKGVATEFEAHLGTKYFDIKLLESNVLIEINPTYTHAAIERYKLAPLYPNYHRDKTQLAEDNGYQCIHVWDWDDWDKVIDLITPKIQIPSSDMSIYRLTLDVTNQFLEENDIAGKCRGQLVSFGLVKDDQIYQVMTFGKPKYDNSYNVQLMRMCTKMGYEVIDGYDKLSHFVSAEYGLSHIITYCDRSKSDGTIHEQLGMKLKRITPPQLIWSKGHKRITANLLRARGYDQLFGTNYGNNVPNEQLMLSNGWLPVYDCGQRVYVFD